MLELSVNRTTTFRYWTRIRIRQNFTFSQGDSAALLSSKEHSQSQQIIRLKLETIKHQMKKNCQTDISDMQTSMKFNILIDLTKDVNNEKDI